MNIRKVLLSLFATMTLLATAIPAADRPNVVIIYGDDVGYGDVGVYGAKLIPTPNIDKLASEGLVFTDGHCSAATCTPSRFSMLTGIHGFRHAVRVLPPNAPLKIKPDMFTLPQLFKKAGYETAVIGKWHLGLGDGKTPVDWNGAVKPGPLEIGFDYSFLLPSTNDRVPCVYLENHRVVNLDPDDPLFVGKKPAGIDCTEYPDGRKDRSAMTYYPSSHGHNSSVINGIGRIGYQWGGKSALWDDETMADEFVRQTKKYLALRTKERPFFLYFSSQDIHVPRAPHPRFRGKSKLTYRGDAMVQLDWATGEVLKALDEHGFAENTLVIFSSDNGPVYDDGYEDGTTVRTSSQEVDRGHDGSGPYRGGKYQIYEGGTRVPLIVKWPGRIEPGISNALVNQIDFIASFAALLHIELADNQAIDSRNMMPAFLGKDHKGLPYTLEEARGQALRRGHWKYVRGKGKNASALYNLETDIGEQNNVAQENEAVARQMKELLQQVINAKRGIRQLDAASEPERAVASGTYAAVLRGNGKTERAYAMTNDREYFAELTEAFFGTNDFYPFNQTQLKKHDPVMYDLLARLWHVDDAEAKQSKPTERRVSPAQRPRPVLDRIKFHSLAEGRELISDESWEPYISAASDDMLRFSIGLRAAAPTFTIGPVRTEDEAFRKWRDSFPLRVGHDHPNEVSAYLSGVLLERDFLQIENEPLNEAHAKRVEQTRSAFRQALRIDAE